MTVEEIVELVVLRISGGKMTTDSSVLRQDVKPYLPDAVNSIMASTVANEFSIEASVHPNPLFLQTYDNITVQTNSRNLAYIAFPVRPLTVVGGRSVVAVGEMGGKMYTRVNHNDGTLNAFYWKTRTDTPTYDVEKDNAVIYNITPGVTELYVTLVEHIDSYEWTDEIFVPSGLEGVLVDRLYEIYVAQKSNPKDMVNDGKDSAQ